MNIVIGLIEETCCNCFTHFAMDAGLRKDKLDNGGAFYCPNGHSQYYTETTITKLKKQNDALTRQRDWAESSAASARQEAEITRRQKAAIKGQLTKTRNRIANGVCPCCNRSFSNVNRHMTTQHPHFKQVVT